MDDFELPPLPAPTWRELRPLNPPAVAAEWFDRRALEDYGLECYRAGFNDAMARAESERG